MAHVAGARVEEPTPYGLPELPVQGLGRGQRSDGGGLQGTRSTRQSRRHALAARVFVGGGDAEGAVCQRHGLVGCLLDTAPTRSRIFFSATKLNCSLPRGGGAV